MGFGRVGSAPTALAIVVITLAASGCGAKSTAMPPVSASQTPYTVGELKRVFARAGITVSAFPIPPVFVGTSHFSRKPVVYLVVAPTARQAHGVGMKKVFAFIRRRFRPCSDGAQHRAKRRDPHTGD
jgi:hypothetical protein